MQETVSGSNVAMWLAAAFFAAWNGLLSLILGTQMKQMKELSKEREEHCMAKRECDRTHETLDKRLDRFESEIKMEVREGMKSIHKRLDMICGGKE